MRAATAILCVALTVTLLSVLPGAGQQVPPQTAPPAQKPAQAAPSAQKPAQASPSTQKPAQVAPPAQKPAQKRPPERKPGGAKKAQKRAPTPPPAPVISPDLTKAVAEQLRVLTRFLYLYGQVSVGMESALADEKRGQASPAAIKKNKENQANIAQTMERLRAGLVNLEEKFGAQPATSVYLPRLSGATATVADAEQLANAGKFDDAGHALETAAERLIELLRDLK